MLRQSFRLLAALKTRFVPERKRTVPLAQLQEALVAPGQPFSHEVQEILQPSALDDGFQYISAPTAHTLSLRDESSPIRQQAPANLAAVWCLERYAPSDSRPGDFLRIDLACQSEAARKSHAVQVTYPLLTLAGKVKDGALVVDRFDVASFPLTPRPSRLHPALAVMRDITQGGAQRDPLRQTHIAFANDGIADWAVGLLNSQRFHDMTVRLAEVAKSRPTSNNFGP